MAYRVGQSNFSKGEVSEELLARIDIDAYSTALKRARNVVVMKYGGVTKRPGTRLVAEVYSDNGVRLMPFQFSLTQTYALEMGQGYMRPAALGGLVLEDKLTVQAVTRGSTTTKIQANYHGYAVGDQVFFDDVLGATWLNGKVARVTSVPDTNNFFVAIASTGKSTLTGDSGGTIRSAPPPPPPPPPPVPPPATVVVDPYVGGIGTYCVAADTLILMADGSEREAVTLHAGEMIKTRHETTLEWGIFPIEAITFAPAMVFKCVFGDAIVYATAEHRFWQDGWVLAGEIGEPSGEMMVAKITVADAHTYISNGVLSHNIKFYL